MCRYHVELIGLVGQRSYFNENQSFNTIDTGLTPQNIMTNPSVYDIAHLGNQAGKAFQLFDPATVRSNRAEEARRVENAPQRRLEAIARALPDALFAEHPGVIKLSLEVRRREARVKRLAETSSQEVAGAVSTLRELLQAAEDRLSDAAIDDALSGDLEFAGALDEMEEIERLGRQVKACLLASKAIRMSPPEQRIFSERAQNARTELDRLLFLLKLDHVRAHPELLSGGMSGT